MTKGLLLSILSESFSTVNTLVRPNGPLVHVRATPVYLLSSVLCVGAFIECTRGLPPFLFCASKNTLFMETREKRFEASQRQARSQGVPDSGPNHPRGEKTT